MTIRLHRGTVVTALALLTTPTVTAHALSGPAATPATPATLELPRPTGPHAVGTQVLHLTDHGRADPQGGGSADRRERRNAP